MESRGCRTSREHRGRCGNSCSCTVTIAVTIATLDVAQSAGPDVAVVHAIAEGVVRLAGTSCIAAAASAAAHAVAHALPITATVAAHAKANYPCCRDPRGILGDKPYTSNTRGGVAVKPLNLLMVVVVVRHSQARIQALSQHGVMLMVLVVLVMLVVLLGRKT